MKKALILIAALPLSACLSFGGKPPKQLLSLTSTAQASPGQESSSATAGTVTVAVPAVPASLATARVPVQVSPTAVAYVKDAQWVEPPQRLFARVLADTIGTRTGRVVLGEAQSYADPGARLTGELRSFGLDASARSAVVIYDAELVRGDGKAVEKRRFEARVPVAAIDAASVGPALNQGANDIAAQVADWVGR